MKLVNKYLELKIDINEKLLHYLFELGIKYYPNEYGGILIGRYSEDRKVVFVSEALNPKAKKLSKHKFDRNVDELVPEIQKYFDQTPSLYYVGEWHTHPNASAIPSSTDMLALHEIVNHNEVYIENPLLLILSIYENQYSFNFFVIFEKKIYNYELEKT